MKNFKKKVMISIFISLVMLSVNVSLLGSTEGVQGGLHSTSYNALLNFNSLSDGVTNSSVLAIEEVAVSHEWNFKYSNSLSALERDSIEALHDIENSAVFQEGYNSYEQYNEIYFTQGESYDFVNQSYNVYLVMTVQGNVNQTCYTYGYSSLNETVYGPEISVGPIVYSSTTQYNENWAGYECYDPSYSITQNTASLTIPSITLSSHPSGYNEAMNGWIGISPYVGGSDPSNSNATNIVQTGFQRIFWYDSWTGGYNWGAYTIWYQTWSNGTSPAYSGGYPGMPAPSSGTSIEFSIVYNSNDIATYVAITLNNYYTYTVTTPYYNSPKYAQYIIETPETDQAGSGIYVISQLAVFSPAVTFVSPSVLTINGYSNLNTLLYNGYYNKYILNQSWGNVNQNINDAITTQSGYMEPNMTWVNSKYNLYGSSGS